MVFNSGVFVIFYLVVFAIYWGVSKSRNVLKIQNVILLVASYFFYGWWDWLFLTLIFASTFVDYFVALTLDRMPDSSKRKWFLGVSVVLNLGLLGTFKYYDFFIQSFVSAAHSISPGLFPHGADTLLLRVMLPVGISFYTFQTMSYTIDVYRRTIRSERSFLDFALFVCFFPQLVAGPIERAGDLMPQIKEKRIFSMDNLAKGLWLCLLGFFMKVYVADNLSPLADTVFMPNAQFFREHPDMPLGGFQVFAGCFAFVFQIYCDFAGYSTIAMGSAMMLGFRLTQNFDAPEFALNPVELFRRWHATLNRWVTDYIYIPLGGSKYGTLKTIRNILITFGLMGFWHGANWTFVIWGLYCGVWLIGYRLLLPYFPHLFPEGTVGAIFSKFIRRFSVFFLFGFTSVFFRAYDIGHSAVLLKALVTFPWDLHSAVGLAPAAWPFVQELISKIWILVLLDYMSVRTQNQFWIFEKPVWLRVIVYFTLFYCILIMGVFGKDVIYFAF